MTTTTFGQLSTARRNNFDFLRFLLAALVIFSHSFPLFAGTNDHEPFYVVTGYQATGGGIAVSFFFVISGFLISQSWIYSRGGWDFFRKRALRICPGFIVVLLFGLLVVGPLGGANLGHYFQNRQTLEYLRPLLLLPISHHLPGVFTSNPLSGEVNGSLWTIPYEIKCYCIVAVLGLLGLLRPRFALVAFVTMSVVFSIRPSLHTHSGILWHLTNQVIWIGIAGLAMIVGAFILWRKKRISAAIFLLVFAAFTLGGLLHEHHAPASYTRLYAHVANVFNTTDSLSFIWLLSFFMAGVVFYLYRDYIPHSPALFAAAILVLVVTAAVHKGFSIILPWCGTYVLLFAAFSPTIKLHHFARHGDISYGVYLYAFPIQQLLMYYFGKHLTPVTLFLCALPITCVLAALSWRFVEQPALKLKSRRRLLLDRFRPARPPEGKLAPVEAETISTV